jgi:hypothetical protein
VQGDLAFAFGWAVALDAVSFEEGKDFGFEACVACRDVGGAGSCA